MYISFKNNTKIFDLNPCSNNYLMTLCGGVYRARHVSVTEQFKLKNMY